MGSAGGPETAGAALREAGVRGHAHLDRACRLSMLVPSTHQITALIRAGAVSAEGPFCSSSCWLPFFMGVSEVVKSHIFSFLTCIFSSDGKREQKLGLAMEEKKRSRPRKRYAAEPASFVRFCVCCLSQF